MKCLLFYARSLGTYISDDVAVCVTPAFESVGWISLNVTVKLESGGIIYTNQDCFYSGRLKYGNLTSNESEVIFE